MQTRADVLSKADLGPIFKVFFQQTTQTDKKLVGIMFRVENSTRNVNE